MAEAEQLIEMEERANGGKEKKYVLYTVVGEEKERAGLGVWIVRILLGTLLLVALAVVPYVSLRLAQVSDRTLVVFQQVPLHNRSGIHQHASAQRRIQHPLESASLLRKITNSTIGFSSNQTTRTLSNSTLVTLHESAVTLSLLEDTSNMTRVQKNQSSDSSQDDHQNEESTISEESVNSTSSSVENDIGINETKNENEIDPDAIEMQEFTEETKTLLEPKENPGSESLTKIDVSTTTNPSVTTSQKAKMALNYTISSKIITILKSTTPSTSVIPSVSSSTLKPVTHKLAYVATASSGNHVGGFCVWKTNKNVTKWTFFYENIPIEYQSHQDNVDHELRGMLAAVRLWHNQWHDYHVVLRSQNQAISKSKHPTRQALLSQLEEFSDGHFTYELEWRLRKDDRLVGIAYCLARLYRDYDYWFNEFEQRVDDLLGAQDWPSAKESKRMQISQKLFHTEVTQPIGNELGDLSSLDLF